MKGFHKLICSVMTAVFIVGAAGCSDGSSADTSSAHRPLYVKEEVKTYEDTDHIFEYDSAEWNGPEGYTIVVPSGNSAARETAELLQDYFKQELQVTLPIVTDKTAEQEKEILVGKTAREQSEKGLEVSELKVSVKGDKLVFDGGHDVTVDSAVKKFIRLAPAANTAYTFTLKTDFVSDLSGSYDGYKYVWGDEFEGNGLDSKNFDLIPKMVGSDEVEISTDKNVVDVNDGRLKLHAIAYYNNNKADVRYRVPCSVVTEQKMNYTYGYLEIRARVPYSPGIWASFWTQSTDCLKGTANEDYMLEVDIFEVFNTYENTPCLIKWYSAEFDYHKRYPDWEPDGVPGTAYDNTPYRKNNYKNPDIYYFEESDSLNYEYHIYAYEWTPTEIKMSIDGEVYVTYDITKSFDAHQDQASFHDPQHVIFNNHIFHPDISYSSASVERTPESLPACYYIDYIRLYQKDGVGELYTADNK